MNVERLVERKHSIEETMKVVDDEEWLKQLIEERQRVKRQINRVYALRGYSPE